MNHDAAPARRADGAMPLPMGAAAALCLALALGACTLQDDRPVALATPEPPVQLSRTAAVPAVKTVRRSVAEAEDDAGPTTAATPSPQQIFDFHPAGSSADAWRQPFVIDPNDGPLAGEVRRSAAELKAFLALPKMGSKVDPRQATRHRCGETDIAAAKPGCAGPAATAATSPAAIP